MFNLTLTYSDLLICEIFSFICTFLPIFCISENYKKTKKTLLIIASIFFSLEGLSMMTVMSTINYQFLVNLLDFTNFIAAFKTNIFKKYIIICIIAFILVIVLICFIYKKFKVKNQRTKYIITCICLLFLLTPFSSIQGFFKTMYNIAYNPDYKRSYQDVFKNITGRDYVDKANLIVSLPDKPKNLVFIILESVEENFMNEEVFGDISKNIKDIAYSGEYYSNIPQINGSNWTIAAMHTLLCGSPRLYNLMKNKLFKTVGLSRLVCLSDVLDVAGYNQLYIGGENKNFSGKGPFLKMHGYSTIYGDKEIFAEYDIPKENRWGWGVKDIDVFNIAKDKYQQLSKLDKPFNLTFNTLNSHAPEGVYDSRCKNSTDDGILNAVECTNDYLKDFIDFLKQQPNYEDTIVVIIPDHLVMRSKAGEISESIGKRTLYAIFLNTGKVEKFDNTILYTDIASMILDRLDIQHNAKFIMYNYEHKTVKERLDFFEKNAKKIQTFNQKTIMQD